MTTPKAQPVLVGKERHCCVCDSKLHGREDKAFCNYQCKNKYHADKRKKRNRGYAKQTNNRLNRNYDILCYLNGTDADKFCVDRLELIRMGFQLNVVSGYEMNKHGLKLNVYEYSWYMTEDQTIMVHRNKKQSEISPFVYDRWKTHMRHKANDL